MVGDDLDLGLRERGIGGEPRGGGVGVGGDGTAFARLTARNASRMTSVTDSRMSVMTSAMPSRDLTIYDCRFTIASGHGTMDGHRRRPTIFSKS